MEYLLLLILGLLGFSYVQYDKRKKAETKATLGNVQGEDKHFSQDQQMIEDQIKIIDEQIAKHKEERKNKSELEKTLQEREKEAQEKFKK